MIKAKKSVAETAWIYEASGQAMVGQAGPGMLASGDGNDSTDSQVVLGVANVHVNAAVL